MSDYFSFEIMIPIDLAKNVYSEANKEKKSVSSWITEAIKKKLDQEEEK